MSMRAPEGDVYRTRSEPPNRVEAAFCLLLLHGTAGGWSPQLNVPRPGSRQPPRANESRHASRF
jgi:hypothetical protein